MSAPILVIGGGLAGVDAAWQIARRGIPVRLYEMRPVRETPVHRTDRLAELVCSNSLRGAELTQAPGLLKEEMRRLGSLVMEAADHSAVPAGSALAVDRERFAAYITEAIERAPLIELIRDEVTAIPAEGPVVVATGPLTSDALAADIRRLLGHDYLSFYDAAAPIVHEHSIDRNKVFLASRYGKGDAAYLNCPMDKAQYEAFVDALLTAEQTERPDYERTAFFEGCVPIEELARRGRDTLRYGPLKPVGLRDPRTGREPYAVVQLRQDNAAATLYNLVGFQTSLKWGEQRRVFRMIPGLEQAVFARFGVMHRNTFINSPLALAPTMQAKQRADLFFAGQLTGVEGYIESAAMGMLAGINAARLRQGLPPLVFPNTTAIGALAHYITHADPEHFQPMNMTFGLLPDPPVRGRGRRDRRAAKARRALEDLARFSALHGLTTASA